VRDAWTDERLDDLSATMSGEFDRVGREFDRVHADLREIRAEMSAMQRSMVVTQRTTVVGFAAVVASVLVTQL